MNDDAVAQPSSGSRRGEWSVSSGVARIRSGSRLQGPETMHAQHALARRLSRLQHSGRQNDAAGAAPPDLGIAGLEHDAAPVRPAVRRRLGHEKVARNGDPFAIDQETDDLATILLRLDEFFRRSTVILAAAGNTDPIFKQAIVHTPFVDVGVDPGCCRQQQHKGCNARSKHDDPYRRGPAPKSAARGSVAITGATRRPNWPSFAAVRAWARQRCPPLPVGWVLTCRAVRRAPVARSQPWPAPWRAEQ